MKNLLTAANASTSGGNRVLADIAAQELRVRIRSSNLSDALAGLACDLCLDQVPVDEAVQRIQDRAMEQMVSMLDMAILSDAAATRSCLALVEQESERAAWQALEKGTEALSETLTQLELLESPTDPPLPN